MLTNNSEVPSVVDEIQKIPNETPNTAEWVKENPRRAVAYLYVTKDEQIADALTEIAN